MTEESQHQNGGKLEMIMRQKAKQNICCHSKKKQSLIQKWSIEDRNLQKELDKLTFTICNDQVPNELPTELKQIIYQYTRTKTIPHLIKIRQTQERINYYCSKWYFYFTQNNNNADPSEIYLLSSFI